MYRWIIALLVAGCLCGCSNKEEELMDCKVFWQLHHTPKHLEETEIEQAYRSTFCNYYERVNDNTVIARNTNTHDVRSLTLKLASMADKKLEGTTDPQLDYRVEVCVYIDFAGKYVEEVWSKLY
jgi:hypothetical protein